MKIALCILLAVALFGVASLVGAWLKICARRDTRLLTEVPKKPPSEAVAQKTGSLWRVTAYCPCEKCCGEFADGITASGAPAVGHIIAAPPEIPFEKIVFIEGYGYAVVRDRGGAIKGKRLDVLFPTHQQALEWGVKYLRLDL